jgi:hypothetical protein
MKPKLIWKSLLVCGIIWAVPFALSIPFFARDGQLLAPFALFKLVMFVALTATAWFALGWLLRQQAMTSGARFGLSMLIAFGNVILDVLILLPITRITWPTYLLTTAIFYIIIPMIALWRGEGNGKTQNLV